MIILDENIKKSQRLLLLDRHIPVRQIGHDAGRAGIMAEIITLLHTMRRATFFTFDFDFFKRELCHQQYSIVYLAVHPDQSADYVRRFLRYPHFNTQAKRMGKVIEITGSGLAVWRLHAERLAEHLWVELQVGG